MSEEAREADDKAEVTAKLSSIAGYLAEHGTLTYSNVGVSMMPLLKQGRDLFTVRAKRPGERLSVGDVALYRRGDDIVLHRVVEVTEGGYVMLGDNCVKREHGIAEDDVFGVMTGYVRRGKTHSVTDRTFRNYTARILKYEKPRIARLKAVARLKAAVPAKVRKALRRNSKTG